MLSNGGESVRVCVVYCKKLMWKKSEGGFSVLELANTLLSGTLVRLRAHSTNDSQHQLGLESTSEMTYIVSGGALNSTHSLGVEADVVQTCQN